MYSSTGSKEYSTLISMIAPFIGLTAMIAIVTSLKDMGTDMIDEGKSLMYNVVPDGSNI